MTVTIWLVRHGLKKIAIGDVSLTAAGIEQAKATAEALRGRPIAAIVSSPLRRAKETAGYAAHALQLEAVVDVRLRERANWGDVPGQTFEQFTATWDRCTAEPHYRPPGGGDTAAAAAGRLSAAVSDWALRCPPGHGILFVTHGGLITDFLSLSLSEAEQNALAHKFAAVQTALIPECSITELLVGPDGLRVGTFADTGHLRGMRPAPPKS